MTLDLPGSGTRQRSRTCLDQVRSKYQGLAWIRCETKTKDLPGSCTRHKDQGIALIWYETKTKDLPGSCTRQRPRTCLDLVRDKDEGLAWIMYETKTKDLPGSGARATRKRAGS